MPFVYPASNSGGGGGGGITFVSHDGSLQGSGTPGSVLAVTFGTTSGTVAQGNDARILGAIQTPNSSVMGDLLYYNGSAWMRLPAGIQGQVLQTNGVEAAPSWVTSSTSGNAVTVQAPLSGNGTSLSPLGLTIGTISGSVAAGNDSRIVNAVPNTRQLIAGTGLSGGGALSSDRTVSVLFGTTTGTVCAGDDARLAGTPLSSATPSALGVAAVGTSSAAARGDHVHPLPTASAVGAVNAPASPAQGDVLYYNGTTYARLAAGTSGYLLQTNGAGANPSWAAPTSGDVNATRAINTTAPLSGGGNLSADRTLALGYNATLTTVANQLAVVYGAASNTACQGNDSRLSDARAPSTTGANGAVMVYAGGAWGNSGAGTSGQFLKSNGTSAPSFSAITTVGASATNTDYIGGALTAYTLQASAYSVATGDYLVGVNTTSGAVTVTLPTPASSGGTSAKVRVVIIKDRNGTSASNNISVVVSGGSTIDGASSVTLGTAYQSQGFACDGTNWFKL